MYENVKVIIKPVYTTFRMLYSNRMLPSYPSLFTAKRFALFSLLTVGAGLLFFFACSPLSAQVKNMTYAVTVSVQDPDAVPGDIVSLQEDHTLKRTSRSFDNLMYGILTDTATIIYHPTDQGLPVVTFGEIPVNVTTFTGDIQPGDLLTSSPIPGKAMKTTNASGWIIGTALEGFSEGQGTQIDFQGRKISSGQVAANIKIGPGSEANAGLVAKLVDQLGTLLFKNIETPDRAERFFRYLLAALVALAAIAIGFGAFGKNITRGIEAIGRNPLAKVQIQAMIILNIFLIAFISIAGVVLALAIIRF